MRAICCPEPYVEIPNEVITTCLPPRTRKLEAAGFNFFQKYEAVEVDDDLSSGAESFSDDIIEEDGTKTHVHHGHKKKNRQNQKQVVGAKQLRDILDRGDNLYDLLNVSDTASQEGLKKAYRQRALETHPDKQKGTPTATEKERLRLIFIRVQEAYEVLSDEGSRKQYDSSLPFEPVVPHINQFDGKPERFFILFGKQFELFGRFSNVKPCPPIGNMDTPITEVNNFYKFYHGYDSWRDYSINDEFDLKEASGRDEKQWMMDENRKTREAEASKDRKLLRALLDLADKWDPRLRKAADEAKERRLQLKKEREQKEREEKAKRAQENYAILHKDRLQAEADAAAAELREQAEADSQLVREAALNAIKDRMNDLKIDRDRVHPVDIEFLVEKQKWGPGRVVSLQEEVMALDFDACTERLEKLYIDHKDEERRKMVEIAKRKADKKKGITSPPAAKVVKPWSSEEVTAFTKGFKKFPGGCSDRWGCISRYIGTRTKDEVIKKAQDMAGANVPLSAITDLNSLIQKSGNYTSCEVGGESTAPSTQAGDVSFGIPADAWSTEQQTALQEALKVYPATMDTKDRWVKIGEAVDGKSAKECLEKFKSIRAALSK